MLNIQLSKFNFVFGPDFEFSEINKRERGRPDSRAKKKIPVRVGRHAPLPHVWHPRWALSTKYHGV